MARSEKLKASAGAKTVQHHQEYAKKGLVKVDVNSGTFNLVVLRRPQRLELGLTSIGVIQVFFNPRTGFGGCSSGFREFRWSVSLRPCSFVAKGDSCALKTVGDITHSTNVGGC